MISTGTGYSVTSSILSREWYKRFLPTMHQNKGIFEVQIKASCGWRTSYACALIRKNWTKVRLMNLHCVSLYILLLWTNTSSKYLGANSNANRNIYVTNLFNVAWTFQIPSVIDNHCQSISLDMLTSVYVVSHSRWGYHIINHHIHDRKGGICDIPSMIASWTALASAPVPLPFKLVWCIQFPPSSCGRSHIEGRRDVQEGELLT